MTSTTDTATRTNKRRRTRGTRATSRNAPTATSATTAPPTTTPTDHHRILGTRLEPIMEVLALQPASLQTHIIAKSNAMLDLLATIKQRGLSHARFMKPLIDAETGDVLKDSAGEQLKFVPNSCRAKCPIKPSQQSNDDDDMKTLLEDAEKDHDNWKQSMAAHARKVSELELRIRNAELRKLFYEFAKDLALTKVVVFDITNGGMIGIALTKEELAHVAVHTTLNAFSLANAAFIGFEDDQDGAMEPASAKLARDYSETLSFDVAAAKNKANIATDGVIVLGIVEELTTLVPALTTDLWRQIQAKERQREINAAIKLALAPQAKMDATEEVAAQLALLDANNPTKSLLDLIDKRTKAGLEKMKQDMKRDLRKNYSAGSNDQELTPTINGQKSRKTSTAASSTKKGKKKKAAVISEQKQKQKRTPRRKNHDSRGESSGGERRKDAGRR